MPKPLDLTNQKFGKLTAIKRAPSRSNKTYWLCLCECGNTKEIQTTHLTTGAISSCGCKKLAAINKIEDKKCPICGTIFTPNNHKRKYCYECSPEGLNASERLRYMDRKLKAILVAHKGGKCERCGYQRCEGALQFHHIDPTKKEFGVGSINFGGFFDMNELIKETDKCILLCANCHAEEHYIEEQK